MFEIIFNTISAYDIRYMTRIAAIAFIFIRRLYHHHHQQQQHHNISILIVNDEYYLDVTVNKLALMDAIQGHGYTM
jgi:hypothetical protein